MSGPAPKPPVRLSKVAATLLRDEPAFLTSRDFGCQVTQGVGDVPALLIGDQAEISLMATAPLTHLEYRMALLAQPGDHVVVRSRDRAFEDYLRTCLGMNNVTFHEVAAPAITPVSRHLRTSETWRRKLAAIAAQNGGLTIKAYLTTGHIWHLARIIGDASGHVVHVCGPSPRVAKRANDKLWFAQLVHTVIGQGATPPTLAAYGPAAAAALVKHISKSADQVIVKVPDSAGSAGNLRLAGSSLRDRSLSQIRDMLVQRLHATGWHDTYPVLVGVWDKNVLCSPSVQLWLGHVSEGQPIVKGVFEQRVQTSAATFSGAVPADLNPDTLARLTAHATRIARVLQHLGCYGLCSFDVVLCKGATGQTAIHWIECNDRWGGVSLPMTTTRHFVPYPAEHPISITQERLPDVHLHTKSLLHQVQDLLFNRTGRTDGIILMSPSDHPNGALLNLCAVAQTQTTANHLLDEAMRRLVVNGEP